MKSFSREKSRVLAENNGWTLAWAEGYIDGEHSRRRGVAPSRHILVGIDDYSLGFRAGYFAIARKSPIARNVVEK